MRCGAVARTWKLATNTRDHSVEKSVVARESIHQENNDIGCEIQHHFASSANTRVKNGNTDRHHQTVLIIYAKGQPYTLASRLDSTRPGC